MIVYVKSCMSKSSLKINTLLCNYCQLQAACMQTIQAADNTSSRQYAQIIFKLSKSKSYFPFLICTNVCEVLYIAPVKQLTQDIFLCAFSSFYTLENYRVIAH